MRTRCLAPAILLVAASAALSNAALAAKPKQKAPVSCAAHSDCKGPSEYCRADFCARLAPGQSYLTVATEEPTPQPAYLYIDGITMGVLPWEGVVSAGPHLVRIESAGMQPVEFQGNSLPGAMDYAPIRMTPARASAGGSWGAAPADPAQPAPEGRKVPGTLRLALAIGAGYGTAVGAGGWRRPTVTLLGGGSLGLRVLTNPVWLDLGASVTSTTLRIQKYPVDKDGDGDARYMKFGDFFKLDVGLLFRLLFPIKKNFFYLGAELNPGVGISNHNYLFADLKFAMSIFPHEMVEIIIDPIGIDYVQELASSHANYIISARAMVGVAIRFPRKPLF